MINILIPEDIPSLNKGEEAILVGMLESFKVLGDFKVNIFSSDPENDSPRYSPHGVNVIDSRRICRQRQAGKLRFLISLARFAFVHAMFILFYKLAGAKANKFTKGDIWNKYLNSEIIILGHDNTFSLLYHGIYIYFFKLLKKTIIIYGATIPDFSEKWSRILARLILNKVDLVTLREERSFNSIKNLGVINPSIYVTADLGFIMPPAPPEVVKAIMQKEGIHKNNNPLIGITLSQDMIRKAFAFHEVKDLKQRYKRGIKVFAEVIDYLIEEKNAKVVFLNHCIRELQDDRIVANDLCSMVKNKNKLKVICNEYAANELKGVIGEFDLLVGSRMHSMINASSMLVPTLPLATAGYYKTEGVIGRMLGQKKLMYELGNLEFNTLIKKIDEIWSSREEIREKLKHILPTVKLKALQNGLLVKEIYEQKMKV